MAPSRTRSIWLILLVAVLFARVAAPEGWMPVANAAGGVEIALCNGQGPADTMVLTPDGKLQHKTPGKMQTGDHPCAFAGIGTADAPPPVVAILAPKAADTAPRRLGETIVPGRGLAAPPPPATGPPALA